MTNKPDKSIKIVVLVIIILIIALVIGVMVVYFTPKSSNNPNNQIEQFEKEKLNQIYYETLSNEYNIYDLNGEYITTVRTMEEVEFYSYNPDFNVNSESINIDQSEILSTDTNLE